MDKREGHRGEDTTGSNLTHARHTKAKSHSTPAPRQHVPFRMGPTKASAPWNDAVAATKAAAANAPFILDASSLVAYVVRVCLGERVE